MHTGSKRASVLISVRGLLPFLFLAHLVRLYLLGLLCRFGS
jgi:hypothetical protein